MPIPFNFCTLIPEGEDAEKQYDDDDTYDDVAADEEEEETEEDEFELEYEDEDEEDEEDDGADNLSDAGDLSDFDEEAENGEEDEYDFDGVKKSGSAAAKKGGRPAPVAPISRLAIKTSSKWPVGSTIRIKFLDGDKVLQRKIQNYAKEWETYANIHFQFVTGSAKSDVRIGMETTEGSWSRLGAEAKEAKWKDKKTMNLAVDSGTPEYLIKRIALHEFGHMLGAVHEHSSPANKIPWNKKAVYKYYKDKKGWLPPKVDQEVLRKFDKNVVTQYTKYDPNSIMNYPIPASLLQPGKENFAVPLTKTLSVTDKLYMRKVYPFDKKPKKPEEEEGEGEEEECEKRKKKPKKKNPKCPEDPCPKPVIINPPPVIINPPPVIIQPPKPVGPPRICGNPACGTTQSWCWPDWQAVGGSLPRPVVTSNPCWRPC